MICFIPLLLQAEPVFLLNLTKYDLFSTFCLVYWVILNLKWQVFEAL